MSGLKPAARALVQETFAALRDKESGYEDGEEWWPEWTPSGTSFLLASRRLRRFESCLQRETLRLPETARAKRFRGALRKNARIAPLIGHLVGTPSTAMLLQEAPSKNHSSGASRAHATDSASILRRSTMPIGNGSPNLPPTHGL